MAVAMAAGRSSEVETLLENVILLFISCRLLANESTSKHEKRFAPDHKDCPGNGSSDKSPDSSPAK